ncbi:MAG: mechanosensitive ion channel family protein [Lewinellaceae bacterium]|nr:mechanosensitive ion channel family protein [Lewinellaceae bacterium]
MEEKTYIDHLVGFGWEYGPKILTALALLVGGLWVIKRITRVFDGFLRARNVDDSLRPFFASLVDVGMKVALLLVVASTIGLETTSFIAIFSAIAFSVGLALQGSLGNFASGVLILLFRPYKVGDMIAVEDKMGKVAEIQIFNTVLLTPQGKRIIIPNGKITEAAIENIGEMSEVRTDVIIQVKDYTPIPTLRTAAAEAIMRCPHRLEGHPIFVEISGFPRDAMQVEVGCWTTGAYYWDTFYFLHESMKIAIDDHGIELAQEDRDD